MKSEELEMQSEFLIYSNYDQVHLVQKNPDMALILAIHV